MELEVVPVEKRLSSGKQKADSSGDDPATRLPWPARRATGPWLCDPLFRGKSLYQMIRYYWLSRSMAKSVTADRANYSPKKKRLEQLSPSISPSLSPISPDNIDGISSTCKRVASDIHPEVSASTFPPHLAGPITSRSRASHSRERPRSTRRPGHVGYRSRSTIWTHPIIPRYSKTCPSSHLSSPENCFESGCTTRG